MIHKLILFTLVTFLVVACFVFVLLMDAIRAIL